MMNEKDKKYIDNMSYEKMLYLNRFSPIGDPMFTGDIGTYFIEEMIKKRDALLPGEAVAISKEIGW